VADWRTTPYAQAIHDGIAAAGFDSLTNRQVDAILDGLLAAELLASGRGESLYHYHGIKPCDYLSKACEHELHGDCRYTCKFCGEACRCTGCTHSASTSHG
jgi:hypothetical protein